MGVNACPRCAADVGVDDRFCERCGLDLTLRRAGTVDARPPRGPCAACGAAPDETDYCGVCGRRLPGGTDHVAADLGRLAGVSDRGHVHARNEDAMAFGLRRDTGVVAAVVCDGVSSTRRPEDASRAAVEAALSVLLNAEPAPVPVPVGAGPEEPRTGRTVRVRPAADSYHVPESAPSVAEEERLLRRAVGAAAEAVAELAAEREADAPSCTLVAALVGPSGRVTVAWVGDSRVYHLDGPNSRLLTADHSWAHEQVAAGVLDPAAAMADPRAHAITRWLGADGKPYPDVTTVDAEGGLLLLCTDGLWNYLPDPGDLARIAGAADTPHGIAALLTRYALDSGGRDNVTVVAIPLPERSPA
ncbi:PP2C family serine/threonine-protein phosphatase [Pseudonocardia yunnanensis]|uniref:PP2C family serine/threonine-protein phosphatase n=1 Tax=Pseudonocardia yunnanensis TaxID=58107 RepID=A0ABW4F9M3_9PSEU